MASMTPEERSRVVGALETSRAGFLDCIRGLSKDQWRFAPAAGGWSIAECADHIVVIERLIFETVRQLAAGAPDPERAARAAGRDDRIVDAVHNRGFKVLVPFETTPTGRSETPETLAECFDELRALVLDYARTTEDSLRDRVARHPFLKDLDGVQWLLLASAHCRRHIAQIEEIKTQPDYPRSAASADQATA